jgi:hypothetical protein|tara:strand:+ start:10374 stop:11078 length:705 start_codon:yes stop_codon:yes gene_type:complete
MPEYKEIAPYRLKNTLLGIHSGWCIDKTTLTLIQDDEKSIQNYEDSEAQKNLKNILQQYVKKHVGDVYSVPLFTQEFCDLILDEISNMQKEFGFEVNPEEDTLRQIPEITLHDNCPELFNNMWSVILNYMNPIFMSIWQRWAVRPGSIQIANYNLADKKQGAWHHDTSADISVVVPLNTGGYTGGGTEFHNRGIVDPLPAGHALFFPSFSHLHRGLPVQKGDRYLLVFWLLGNF